MNDQVEKNQEGRSIIEEDVDILNTNSDIFLWRCMTIKSGMGI